MAEDRVTLGRRYVVDAEWVAGRIGGEDAARGDSLGGHRARAGSRMYKAHVSHTTQMYQRTNETENIFQQNTK